MIGRLLLVLIMLPALLPAAIVAALVVCGRFVVRGSERSAYYRTSATPSFAVSSNTLNAYAAKVTEAMRARRSAQN